MGNDRVSDYLEQWQRERPDLDPTPMGVIGRVSRFQEVAHRALATYFAAHGLQRGEFDVLATLRRAGDPFTLTPGQLASSTMVSSAAMTNRLARLESKGLLNRRTDTANRRHVLVELTPQGLKLIDDIVPGHLANERAVLAPLSSGEQRQLASLLEKLLAASGDVSQLKR